MSPFTIERTYDAPADLVWKAITQKELMKQWYFDLKEFKAEPGFVFEFTGGPAPDRQYLHHCEIIEVLPGKKLKHSWSYVNYEGMSYVTFELFPEGNKTKLKLTHEGLDTFPVSNPDFAPSNFGTGWTQIIGTSLKEFVEKQ
jgi:uncharacterized protein YndB with AHSA1/START domain